MQPSSSPLPPKALHTEEDTVATIEEFMAVDTAFEHWVRHCQSEHHQQQHGKHQHADGGGGSRSAGGAPQRRHRLIGDNDDAVAGSSRYIGRHASIFGGGHDEEDDNEAHAEEEDASHQQQQQQRSNSNKANTNSNNNNNKSTATSASFIRNRAPGVSAKGAATAAVGVGGSVLMTGPEGANGGGGGVGVGGSSSTTSPLLLARKASQKAALASIASFAAPKPVANSADGEALATAKEALLGTFAAMMNSTTSNGDAPKNGDSGSGAKEQQQQQQRSQGPVNATLPVRPSTAGGGLDVTSLAALYHEYTAALSNWDPTAIPSPSTSTSSNGGVISESKRVVDMFIAAAHALGGGGKRTVKEENITATTTAPAAELVTPEEEAAAANAVLADHYHDAHYWLNTEAQKLRCTPFHIEHDGLVSGPKELKTHANHRALAVVERCLGRQQGLLKGGGGDGGESSSTIPPALRANNNNTNINANTKSSDAHDSPPSAHDGNANASSRLAAFAHAAPPPRWNAEDPCVAVLDPFTAVDLTEPALVHVWQSSHEGQRFQLSFQTITNALTHHLLSLGIFSASLTIIGRLLGDGRLVTVAWLPPLAVGTSITAGDGLPKKSITRAVLELVHAKVGGMPSRAAPTAEQQQQQQQQQAAVSVASPRGGSSSASASAALQYSLLGVFPGRDGRYYLLPNTTGYFIRKRHYAPPSGGGGRNGGEGSNTTAMGPEGTAAAEDNATEEAQQRERLRERILHKHKSGNANDGPESNDNTDASLDRYAQEMPPMPLPAEEDEAQGLMVLKRLIAYTRDPTYSEHSAASIDGVAEAVHDAGVSIQSIYRIVNKDELWQSVWEEVRNTVIKRNSKGKEKAGDAIIISPASPLQSDSAGAGAASGDASPLPPPATTTSAKPLSATMEMKLVNKLKETRRAVMRLARIQVAGRSLRALRDALVDRRGKDAANYIANVLANALEAQPPLPAPPAAATSSVTADGTTTKTATTTAIPPLTINRAKNQMDFAAVCLLVDEVARARFGARPAEVEVKLSPRSPTRTAAAAAPPSGSAPPPPLTAAGLAITAAGGADAGYETALLDPLALQAVIDMTRRRVAQQSVLTPRAGEGGEEDNTTNNILANESFYSRYTAEEVAMMGGFGGSFGSNPLLEASQRSGGGGGDSSARLTSPRRAKLLSAKLLENSALALHTDSFTSGTATVAAANANRLMDLGMGGIETDDNDAVQQSAKVMLMMPIATKGTFEQRIDATRERLEAAMTVDPAADLPRRYLLLQTAAASLIPLLREVAINGQPSQHQSVQRIVKEVISAAIRTETKISAALQTFVYMASVMPFASVTRYVSGLSSVFHTSLLRLAQLFATPKRKSQQPQAAPQQQQNGATTATATQPSAGGNEPPTTITATPASSAEEEDTLIATGMTSIDEADWGSLPEVDMPVVASYLAQLLAAVGCTEGQSQLRRRLADVKVYERVAEKALMKVLGMVARRGGIGAASSPSLHSPRVGGGGAAGRPPTAPSQHASPRGGGPSLPLVPSSLPRSVVLPVEALDRAIIAIQRQEEKAYQRRQKEERERKASSRPPSAPHDGPFSPPEPLELVSAEERVLLPATDVTAVHWLVQHAPQFTASQRGDLVEALRPPDGPPIPPELFTQCLHEVFVASLREEEQRQKQKQLGGQQKEKCRARIIDSALLAKAMARLLTVYPDLAAGGAGGALRRRDIHRSYANLAASVRLAQSITAAATSADGLLLISQRKRSSVGVGAQQHSQAQQTATATASSMDAEKKRLGKVSDFGEEVLVESDPDDDGLSPRGGNGGNASSSRNASPRAAFKRNQSVVGDAIARVRRVMLEADNNAAAEAEATNANANAAAGRPPSGRAANHSTASSSSVAALAGVPLRPVPRALRSKLLGAMLFQWPTLCGSGSVATTPLPPAHRHLYHPRHTPLSAEEMLAMLRNKWAEYCEASEGGGGGGGGDAMARSGTNSKAAAEEGNGASSTSPMGGKKRSIADSSAARLTAEELQTEQAVQEALTVAVLGQKKGAAALAEAAAATAAMANQPTAAVGAVPLQAEASFMPMGGAAGLLAPSNMETADGLAPPAPLLQKAAFTAMELRRVALLSSTSSSLSPPEESHDSSAAAVTCSLWLPQHARHGFVGYAFKQAEAPPPPPAVAAPPAVDAPAPPTAAAVVVAPAAPPKPPAAATAVAKPDTSKEDAAAAEEEAKRMRTEALQMDRDAISTARSVGSAARIIAAALADLPAPPTSAPATSAAPSSAPPPSSSAPLAPPTPAVISTVAAAPSDKTAAGPSVAARVTVAPPPATNTTTPNTAVAPPVVGVAAAPMLMPAVKPTVAAEVLVAIPRKDPSDDAAPPPAAVNDGDTAAANDTAAADIRQQTLSIATAVDAAAADARRKKKVTVVASEKEPPVLSVPIMVAAPASAEDGLGEPLAPQPATATSESEKQPTADEATVPPAAGVAKPTAARRSAAGSPTKVAVAAEAAKKKAPVPAAARGGGGTSVKNKPLLAPIQAQSSTSAAANNNSKRSPSTGGAVVSSFSSSTAASSSPKASASSPSVTASSRSVTASPRTLLSPIFRKQTAAKRKDVAGAEVDTTIPAHILDRTPLPLPRFVSGLPQKQQGSGNGGGGASTSRALVTAGPTDVNVNTTTTNGTGAETERSWAPRTARSTSVSGIGGAGGSSGIDVGAAKVPPRPLAYDSANPYLARQHRRLGSPKQRKGIVTLKDEQALEASALCVSGGGGGSTERARGVIDGESGASPRCGAAAAAGRQLSVSNNNDDADDPTISAADKSKGVVVAVNRSRSKSNNNVSAAKAGGWDSTTTNLAKYFSAYPRSPRGAFYLHDPPSIAIPSADDDDDHFDGRIADDYNAAVGGGHHAPMDTASGLRTAAKARGKRGTTVVTSKPAAKSGFTPDPQLEGSGGAAAEDETTLSSSSPRTWGRQCCFHLPPHHATSDHGQRKASTVSRSPHAAKKGGERERPLALTPAVTVQPCDSHVNDNGEGPVARLVELSPTQQSYLARRGHNARGGGGSTNTRHGEILISPSSMNGSPRSGTDSHELSLSSPTGTHPNDSNSSRSHSHSHSQLPPLVMNSSSSNNAAMAKLKGPGTSAAASPTATGRQAQQQQQAPAAGRRAEGAVLSPVQHNKSTAGSHAASPAGTGPSASAALGRWRSRGD